MNTNNEQQKEAAGIIARILVALKVPGNWAKVIAGAIMGAIAAWMGMTQTSCASTVAGMIATAAFLAPLISTSPWRVLGPLMIYFSKADSP